MGLISKIRRMSKLQKRFFVIGCIANIMVWGSYALDQIKINKQRAAKENYFVSPQTIKSTKNYPEMDSLEECLRMSDLRANDVSEYIGSDKFLESYVQDLDKYGIDFGIKLTKTPVEARILVKTYMKRNGDQANKKYYPAREVHYKRMEVDCSEASEIAAAALHDNGYQPLILHLSPSRREIKKNKEAVPHSVFLYKYNGMFGFVDNNSVVEPLFPNINELVRFIGKNLKQNYTKYRIFDLSTNPDWMKKNDPDKIPYYRKLRKEKSESVLYR